MRSLDIRRLLPVVLLGVFGACIDDDEAVVFVDPSILDPTATVSSSALGTGLNGSFRLTLRLGPRASGPSTVSVLSLSITDSTQKTTLVSPLEASTATAFPVQVPVDGQTQIDFTFDTGASLLPAAAKDGLCAPSGIRIVGSIQDSLQDGATPLVSAIFLPAGCT